MSKHSNVDAAKFSAFFRREVEKWSKVMRQGGLKSE